MDFEILGELSVVEIIAVNLSVRESADLKARYGGRRWRKLSRQIPFDASMGPTRPDASLAVTPKAQKGRLGP
jgi:hypothetical protein